MVKKDNEENMNVVIMKSRDEETRVFHFRIVAKQRQTLIIIR